MKKLTHVQVKHLHECLVRKGANGALLDELLDHVICEVEHYMWIGLPFETALDKVLLEANEQAVTYLNATYQAELNLENSRHATLDDIVFEYRNKHYGAYDLRQTYRANLRNALLLGVGLFLLSVVWVAALRQGSFSYWSGLGVVWLLGLSSVSFALGSWYLINAKQRYMIID